MSRTQKFLLASGIALVLGAVIVGSGGRPAHAQSGGGDIAATNGRYLAITGLSRESTETLYLIDTENQVLLAYETNRSQGIRLQAVRSFKYDSKILEYNDLSEKEFRASALKERFEKDKEGDK